LRGAEGAGPGAPVLLAPALTATQRVFPTPELTQKAGLFDLAFESLQGSVDVFGLPHDDGRAIEHAIARRPWSCE
jgi:hypothetical protein